MWRQITAVAFLIVAAAFVVFAVATWPASSQRRMSTRLRVFVWFVIAVAAVIWIAAIWFVIFQPGPLPFLPLKLT
ncbi:MAG: hypothetical protein WAK90_09680 [Pseudolabrys sp.]|jgi:hypothetical protein